MAGICTATVLVLLAAAAFQLSASQTPVPAKPLGMHNSASGWYASAKKCTRLHALVFLQALCIKQLATQTLSSKRSMTSECHNTT